MKIGNLDIGNKLFLAPMAEVTDSSFRKICKSYGAGITFTQMVSAEGVIKNNFETLRHFSFNRSEKPIGVQVLGNDPEILFEASKEISKHNPDLIDLNCGCPVEKVCSKNMGSALLDDPKMIGKLVRKMVDGSNGVPISVKIRLGRDRSRINVFDNARAIQDNGASLIFIHARTRADKYDTLADWSWLKKVKETITLPIVGNGSLFSPHDVKDMLDFTGCDSAMIARGALGNPFLFSRFNELLETGTDPGEPHSSIVLQTVLQHINNLEQEFGEIVALNKAKKHSLWYFKYHSGVKYLLDRVFSIKNLNDLRQLIEEHADQILHTPVNVDENKIIHKKFQRKVLYWLAEENITVSCKD
ncbi:MAG: tRNA dihydrouridine synthase DusB [Ignavibacteriae bacterium HGW-Ignavibacteriae-3]|nr:MAG: tRNA dihydrouridine synthase DusB [Ignavibacteriae bacterium HGW-Ignavibacteriae-3]